MITADRTAVDLIENENDRLAQIVAVLVLTHHQTLILTGIGIVKEEAAVMIDTEIVKELEVAVEKGTGVVARIEVEIAEMIMIKIGLENTKGVEVKTGTL